MNDPEFSINSTLKLDFSSADKLDKSLKAKKITKSNIQLIFNEIKQHQQSETFVVEVLVKFLFEKIISLEDDVFELQEVINNFNETNENYIKKELQMGCCITEAQTKLAAFQDEVITKLDIKWVSNSDIKVNKNDNKKFNEIWIKHALHSCLVSFGPSGNSYSNKYYFSFK